MHNGFSKCVLFVPVLSMLLTSSCNEIEEVPVLMTNEATEITMNSAISGGIITSDGGANITTSGVCWSTGTEPTIADKKTNDAPVNGSFTSSIKGLYGATTYYVRAYATNSAGTGYGTLVSFTTSGETKAPTITKATVTGITVNSATLKGEANANFLSTQIYFEYGKTTDYGSIKYGSYGVTGSIPTTVSAFVDDLEAGTTYHYRLKAKNSIGTTYSNDITFITLTPGFGDIIFNPGLSYNTVTDLEGNIYKTIQIGTQTWMAENLKVVTYNDSTLIPAKSGYCWYNNDSSSYRPMYGALYSWEAVKTGKLCPTGWHIPTMEEVILLSTYLGGDSISGRKLKETGSTHWIAPNTGATNTSGFTALPCGYQEYKNGSYKNIGSRGFWWTSTTVIRTVTGVDLVGHSYLILQYNYGDAMWVPLNNGLQFISVRCIKN